MINSNGDAGRGEAFDAHHITGRPDEQMSDTVARALRVSPSLTLRFRQPCKWPLNGLKIILQSLQGVQCTLLFPNSMDLSGMVWKGAVTSIRACRRSSTLHADP
jgi:hypothetical protein